MNSIELNDEQWLMSVRCLAKANFRPIRTIIDVNILSNVSSTIMYISRLVWWWFWTQSAMPGHASITTQTVVRAAKIKSKSWKAAEWFGFGFGCSFYLFEAKLMLSTNALASFKLFKLVVGWLSAYWTICTVWPIFRGFATLLWQINFTLIHWKEKKSNEKRTRNHNR